MIENSLFILFGFLLGIRHAFDVDHVVAVNTMIAKTKNVFSASRLGIYWGLGHTLTIFVVALFIHLLGLEIPSSLSLFLEALVGFMLIYIGISSLRKKFATKLEGINSSKRSFGIGAIHGLAGSSAILLILFSQPSSLQGALSYLFLFGLGSIIGMVLVSTILHISLSKANSLFNKRLDISAISGYLSIVIGTIIVVEIGIKSNLFF